MLARKEQIPEQPDRQIKYKGNPYNLGDTKSAQFERFRKRPSTHDVPDPQDNLDSESIPKACIGKQNIQSTK